MTQISVAMLSGAIIVSAIIIGATFTAMAAAVTKIAEAMEYRADMEWKISRDELQHGNGQP